MNTPLTPASGVVSEPFSPATLSRDEASAVGPINPEIEVSLCCPECEHTCHVPWDRLAQGFYCPVCQTVFDILPSRVRKRSTRGPLELSFNCPRCLQVNTLPTSKAAQGATCQGCQLELLPGPDKRLHDKPQLRAMKTQARRESFAGPTAAGLQPNQVRLILIGVGSLLGLIFVVWMGVWLLRTVTMEDHARELTFACLTGQRALDAEAWVGEDSDQLAAFEHWRIMHFASLSVALKNAKDRPQVSATVVRQDPQRQILRVEMASRIIGRRTLTQIWRWDETLAVWQFDAKATLADPRAGD